MPIKETTLNQIADGFITLVFRKWKRPTATTGGSLRTIIGIRAIESV